MEESHITNESGEEGGREKISETTDTARPTPPEPPLWRIASPEIVLGPPGREPPEAT